MTHKLQTTRIKMVMTFLTIVSFIAVVIASCTKSSDSSSSPNYATQFIGTWTGTTTCTGAATGGAGGVTISAGSGNNTLTTAGSVGSGSCSKSVTLNGTASATTFSFPSQTFTDNCGNSYTFAISGSISGSTLTTTQSISGAVSASCTFTGTK